MKFLLFIAQTVVDPNGLNVPKPVANESQIQTVLSIVFGIAAAVSVLMIVIAGLNYVLSSGDPQKTAKAKDTILYSVIGLVVSVLAITIVAFAIERIT